MTLEAHPMTERFAIAADAYCGYLWKMVLPFDLAPIYPIACI